MGTQGSQVRPCHLDAEERSPRARPHWDPMVPTGRSQAASCLHLTNTCRAPQYHVPRSSGLPRNTAEWKQACHSSSPRVTYLSPNADCVPDVIFAVRKLPDAIVDSNAAFPGGEVLLCHLHPSQRAHGKTLEDRVRHVKFLMGHRRSTSTHPRSLCTVRLVVFNCHILFDHLTLMVGKLNCD